VEKDSNYMYLFTDNAQRTSGRNVIADESRYAAMYGKGLKYPGQTQAVIRGLNNAFPITTMVNDKRVQWTDNKFNEYKKIIDDEIEVIKQNLQYFKGIKFAAFMPFGKGQISNMKDSAPKIWNYLNIKLMEIGIDNTGKILSSFVQKETVEEYDFDKIHEKVEAGIPISEDDMERYMEDLMERGNEVKKKC